MRKYIINQKNIEAEVLHLSQSRVEIRLEDQVFSYELRRNAQGEKTLVSKTGEEFPLYGNDKTIVAGGVDFKVAPFLGEKSQARSAGGDMKSPMPGKILKVLVSQNDQVKQGDPLIIMEAMKMEHTIVASCDGKIKELMCAEGELVEGEKELISLES